MDEFVIKSNGVEIFARFIKRNPMTREKIKQNLPLSGVSKLYMEEVYFSTSIDIDEEVSSKEVNKGDIGFWPRGNAICFFYGETDPVSPVNVFAEITGGLDEFKKISEGDKIKINSI